MIWIATYLLILFEAAVHWLLIEVLEIDPTPNKLTWKNVLTVAVRGVYLLLFVFTDYPFISHEFLMFALGAFFSHLLFFPIVLNLMRGKPIAYLSEYGIDKLLNMVTHRFFPLRVAWLLILISGFIYGYYHTELL
jgi:hypothetical protein